MPSCNKSDIKDGPTIYYKDWGGKNAQPIVSIMAGRSSQVSDGLDHAADAAAVVAHLDLREAILVGRCPG